MHPYASVSGLALPTIATHKRVSKIHIQIKGQKVKKTNTCGWIYLLPSSSTQNKTKYLLSGVAQFSLLLNYESKYLIFFQC